MKKFMIGAAAFCCMLFSSVALTACGSDDNDNDDSGKTDPYALKEIVMEVKFKEPQDMLDVCDAKVTVNGETETVTSADWTKSVKTTVLPAHFSISLKMSKKAGKDWEAGKMYEFAYPPVEYAIKLVRANGEISTIASTPSTSHGGFPGGQEMDIALSKISEYSIEYDVDKNGKATSKK